MVLLGCGRAPIVTLKETVWDKLRAADADAEKPKNNVWT
jgi:hypothetical protein